MFYLAEGNVGIYIFAKIGNTISTFEGEQLEAQLSGFSFQAMQGGLMLRQYFLVPWHCSGWDPVSVGSDSIIIWGSHQTLGCCSYTSSIWCINYWCSHLLPSQWATNYCHVAVFTSKSSCAVMQCTTMAVTMEHSVKRLNSNGDVSPLNHLTILGHECIVIVYLGQILSWLITSPLV